MKTWLSALLLVLCAFGSQAEDWTLQQSITEALRRNPDARLAQSRIAAAQAGLEEANAVFWPRLQFQSSYTRTDNPMMVFGSILNQRAYPSAGLDFNDVPDVDDLNIRGVATVPIYTGGRIRAGRESAKAAATAAREDSAAVRNALAFEVARAFHTVLKTRQFINAAASAENAFEKNVEVARKRLAAGALLRSDVLDLQVRAAEARENLVRARNANALAIRVLRNLIGIEEGEFSVADEVPAVAVPESFAMFQRPEIGAAKARQRAAEEQVRGAKSGYLPRVSAFGSLDYDYGWKYANGGGSYTAGGLLQWDIWDGHLTRAKVRQAEASLDSAREEARKTSLGIDLELERARLELKSANERLAVTAEAVSHAAESAEITRARFEQGEALATQLIDAETALVGARVRRAEAEADQRIAIGALRKALGSPQLDSK